MLNLQKESRKENNWSLAVPQKTPETFGGKKGFTMPQFEMLMRQLENIQSEIKSAREAQVTISERIVRVEAQLAERSEDIREHRDTVKVIKNEFHETNRKIENVEQTITWVRWIAITFGIAIPVYLLDLIPKIYSVIQLLRGDHHY